jgi:transcriptional regulator with XRE-family HTH domain
MSTDASGPSDVMRAFGSCLRDARERSAITPRELADRCGLPEAQIEATESGHADVRVSLLETLAVALEVTPAAIVADLPRYLPLPA